MLVHPQCLEERIVYDTAPPFAAVDDFVAVPAASESNLILAMANDRLTAGSSSLPVRISKVSVPLHGSATFAAVSQEIRYSPAAGYEGLDSFTYELVDTAGTKSVATIRVRVGLTAQDPGPIEEQFPSSTGEDSEDWLTELEQGSGDIILPDGGVTIDRVVVISQARRILGNGQTLRIAGEGKLVVSPASPNAAFELLNATVIWDRKFQSSGHSQAIEILGGEVTIASNRFYALALPSDLAYANVSDIDDALPAGYLIRVGSANEAPNFLRITENRFSNVYWYGAGAVDVRPAAPITNAVISGNELDYFHHAFKLRGLPSASIAENEFLENTGTNLLISNSAGVVVERNRFNFPSGGLDSDAVRLEDLIGGRVSENFIMNGGGTGIRLAGIIAEVEIALNVVHSAAGTGIAIESIEGKSPTVAWNITISGNNLAQNAGWAIEASGLTAVRLIENVLHQNRTEDQFQHRFTDVTILEDVRNLWDVDFLPNDAGQAAMFGINARTYSFTQGEIYDETERITTPLDLDAVRARQPVGNSDRDTAWMLELETGSGDIIVPASGVIIDRPIVVRNPRRIIGQGNSLMLTGRGAINIAMDSAESNFEIENAYLIWNRDIGQDGAANGVTLIKGGLILRDNQGYSLVTPARHFYEDPALLDQVNRTRLAQSTSPVYFFDLESRSDAPGQLIIEGNTFENARWYSSGFLFSSETSKFTSTIIRDNTIKYFHGALYINGADGGLVEGNRFYRNSFGNLILRNSANLVVQFNRLEFPGNGTSGDGATMWGLTNLLFRQNLITNGSCYGIWALDNMIAPRFVDNVIHAGITSALRIEPITAGGVVKDVTIQGNLFSHNNSWGLSGQIIEGISIFDNLFHQNVAGAFDLQHHFWDAEHVVAKGNLKTRDAVADSAEQLFGSELDPYFMFSEGTDLLHDEEGWTFRGKDRADMFRVLIEDKVHVQVNGEWRTVPLSEVTHVTISGNGGQDTTLIFLSPAGTIALLAPGSANVFEPGVQIVTESEINSVYGHQHAFALAVDSPGNDRLYASPGYIRSYGTGFENYAAGFGGTLTYSTKGNDLATIDDGSKTDLARVSENTACMVGDTFHHSMTGFRDVIFRSNVGGVDRVEFQINDPSQLTAIAGGMQFRQGTRTTRALGFENVVSSFGDDVESFTAPGGCLNYGPILLPVGSLQGNLLEVNAASAKGAAEQGIAGRAVFLDLNRNGVLDPDEPATVTSAEGKFEFADVVPGIYSVVQAVPDDWMAIDAAQEIIVWPNRAITGVTLRSVHTFVIEKNTLHVFGTPGSDAFEFDASGPGAKVRVNGAERTIDMAAVRTLRIHGLGGEDHANLIGSAGNDSLVVHADDAEFIIPGLKITLSEIQEVTARDTSGGYDVVAIFDSPGDDEYHGQLNSGEMFRPSSHTLVEGFDRINVHSVNGGVDRAILSDSTADDDLIATPEFSRMMGSGYYQYLRGFKTVEAASTHGGADRASLYDSPQDELLVATPTTARLTGAALDFLVEGFDRVSAYATAGGNDEAKLTDSPGEDEFVATPAYGRMLGPGYYNFVQGFDRIEVQANSGGVDRASVYDSAGDDKFTGKPGLSRLQGPAFDHELHQFEFVYAYATSGGIDRAELHDSAGNDELISTATFSRLLGNGFYIYTQRFDQVEAFAALGGIDDVSLFDSPDDDEFISKPGEFSSFRGPKLNNSVYKFDTVRAYATAGGHDKATLYDTPVDDELVSTPHFSRLQGGGFYAYAQQFDEVHVNATRGGEDRAQLHDSTGDDTLEASPLNGRLSGPGFDNRVTGFEAIYAFASSGGHDTARLTDSAGNDDFISNPNLVRLYNNDFYLYVTKFEDNIVTSVGGNDLAEIRDIRTGNELKGRNNESNFQRGVTAETLLNFDRLVAHGKEASLSDVDVSAVDYLFERIGVWN